MIKQFDILLNKIVKKYNVRGMIRWKTSHRLHKAFLISNI